MRERSTYRSERRNEWRGLNRWLGSAAVEWTDFNAGNPGASRWHIGTTKPLHVPTNHLRQSRYMPHIGKKERARHAGKPEGAMHVTGHQRLAEWRQWMTTVAAA